MAKSPVRVGILGCGGYGRYHIEMLSKVSEARVVGLYGPRSGSIQETLSEFPSLAGCPVYPDEQALFESPEIDAVVIASPHYAHVNQIVASLRAGKHVLVEKPMATTIADAHRVIAERDKLDKVVAVAYQRHGFGNFRYLRELIVSGSLGAVRAMNSHLARPWLQLTKGTWRQSREKSCGGQIGDGGSHLIDAVLWMTGLRAESVSAIMDNRETEVDIDSVVNVRFTNGALGTFTVIGDSNAWHEQHHIWLERGAVSFVNGKISVFDNQGHRTEASNFPPNIAVDQNFIDSILHGAEILAPCESGLHTIELTEAAWMSAQQGGRPVTL